MIPVALVGLIFSLSTLWDGVVDPLIGTMVDRVRIGPAAHRRWMLLALLPLGLLLATIVGIGNALPFALLLATMLLFTSSGSLFDVAHLAWGSALARTPDETARIFGAREWAAKWVLIAAFAAPAIAQFAIPGLSLQGRIIAYASLFLIALPLAVVSVFRIPPRETLPEPGIGWRAELAATLRFRPLLLVIAVQFLNAFSFGALTSLFVFFADGTLGLDGSSAVMLFATFVGGALFTPLWIHAARRWGKPRTMIGMAGWLVLILSFSFVFDRESGLIAGAAFSLVLGSGFVGLIFIHGMIADIVPEDRARTGRDRSGFLFAVCNVLQKAGVAGAIAVSYAALGWFGFDAKNAAASASEIHWLFVGLPMASWSAMALLLLVLLREPALASPRDSH